MQKILTKEILLEKTFNELRTTNEFETYTFDEKKQYLKCLREVKAEYIELQNKIIENNLDQSVLKSNQFIKIKDILKLLKETIRDLPIK